MLDKKKLLAEADGLTIAEYLGLDVVKKGNRNCIKCPGHTARLGHEDRNIGNCVLTEHGYHCYACGVSVDVISMVIEVTGCSFADALKTIADALGGEKYFSDNRAFEQDAFMLPKAQSAGINNPGQCLCIVNVSDTPPDREIYPLNKYTYKQKGDLYYVYKIQKSPLTVMCNDDPVTFKKLLKKFSDKQEADLNTAIEQCCRSSENAALIYEMFEKDGELKEEILCELQNYYRKKLFSVKEFKRKNHLL